MSNGRNQNLRFWQDVGAKLRRNRYKLGENTLSDNQNLVVADGYTLMLVAWSDLASFSLSPTSIHNMVHILCSHSVDEVVDFLKDADKSLIAELQKEKITSWASFKHSLRIVHGDVCGLISFISSLWEELVSSQIRALPAADIHTCFSFIGRLNIPDLENLRDDAEKAFLLREDSLRRHLIYTYDEPDIVRQWFPNNIRTYESLYGSWVPAHGDGAVADSKKELCYKYHALGTDDDLNYLNLFTGGLGYPRALGSFQRVAKVTFVAKSIDKLRAVCAEPSTLMFYQQGFQSTLVRYISHHTYLKRRIDFARPNENVKLAMIGSESGKFATIDLSDASDSISWRMVRQWFRFTPLLDALECTRSTMYDIEGTVRWSSKFAPMGSALCFPIMCLIFTAMCEATIWESGGDPYSSKYRVYGDDIIIETQYADALMRRLEANGFSVNVKKSFTTCTPHNYRESCGGEFLDGYPMRPIRLSRRFSGLELGQSASRREALVDLANDCYYHLPTVRLFVLSALLKQPARYRPLFSDEYGKGSILSDQPTNFHLESKYSVNLQRIRYQCGSSRILKGVLQEADEDIRFYEWLRSTASRVPDSALTESSVFLLHTPTIKSKQADLISSRWT